MNYLFLCFALLMANINNHRTMTYPIEEVSEFGNCTPFVISNSTANRQHTTLISDKISLKKFQAQLGDCLDASKFDFEHYVYVFAHSTASGCSANMQAKADWNEQTNNLVISVEVKEYGNCQPLRFFSKCYAVKKPNTTCTFGHNFNFSHHN